MRFGEHRTDQPFDVRHQCVMIDPQAIPFDECELGIVKAPGFAVAIYAADLPDICASSGEQTLHRILRRRMQKTATLQRCGFDACEMYVSDRCSTERRRFHFECSSSDE